MEGKFQVQYFDNIQNKLVNLFYDDTYDFVYTITQVLRNPDMSLSAVNYRIDKEEEDE